MPRAKLICTLGPSTKSEKVVMGLVKAGMNVARLNFSHDTHDEFRKSIALVRKIAEKTGKPISILGDLCGPKIRIGDIEGGSFELKTGDKLSITTRKITGVPGLVSTTYPNLVSDVEKGDHVLIDDGNLDLIVESVKPNEVITRVIYGGFLKEHKGMNLPGVNVSAPSISTKDFSDIEFAVKEGIDLLALSFVRKTADVVKAKKIISNYGSDIPVIAKIEKEEAVNDIENIVKESYGIMIARGDLGVEMASERVPLIQKKIIKICNNLGKPVITATQMLESMISNPRATRAETSDVANAIIDGSDAVMLSGETSVGKYPIEAAKTVGRIIIDVEREIGKGRSFADWTPVESTIADAVTAAACRAAEILNAKVILAYTQSGSTAMRLSKHRPKTRMLAITPSEYIRRRIEIFWGIRSALIENVIETDKIAETAEEISKKEGLAKKGDIIVITFGTPIGIAGSTNLMNIIKVN
ncbi:pyruvate kinase [Candidatus Latescibacterota bacterium]